MISTWIDKKKLPVLFAFAGLVCSAGSASAAVIDWTDWQTQGPGPGFTGNGVITTATTTVNVTYTNANGISFYQTSGGTDYWVSTPGFVRNPAVSPYTSALVDNIPTGTDIIALRLRHSAAVRL